MSLLCFLKARPFPDRGDGWWLPPPQYGSYKRKRRKAAEPEPPEAVAPEPEPTQAEPPPAWFALVDQQLVALRVLLVDLEAAERRAADDMARLAAEQALADARRAIELHQALVFQRRRRRRRLMAAAALH